MKPAFVLSFSCTRLDHVLHLKQFPTPRGDESTPLLASHIIESMHEISHTDTDTYAHTRTHIHRLPADIRTHR